MKSCWFWEILDHDHQLNCYFSCQYHPHSPQSPGCCLNHGHRHSLLILTSFLVNVHEGVAHLDMNVVVVTESTLLVSERVIRPSRCSQQMASCWTCISWGRGDQLFFMNVVAYSNQTRQSFAVHSILHQPFWFQSNLNWSVFSHATSIVMLVSQQHLSHKYEFV